VNEEWKPIPDLPGYEVSNHGRIRSIAKTVSHRRYGVMRIKARILQTSVHKSGYVVISIKRKTRRVHRLVLESFHGVCPANHECRHLDGIRTNNRIDNLMWGSLSENENDKFQHGTDKGMKIKRSDGKVFRSQRDAARQTGCAQSGIRQVLLGLASQCAGYGWERI
jgi:hypothetical protein